MRGAPLATREEFEAGEDARENEDRMRADLSSAIGKLDRAFRQLPPARRAKLDQEVRLFLTIGELRALKRFGQKHHND